MQNDCLADVVSESELTLFQYAQKLTLSAASVTSDDVCKIRDAGYDDGQILEVNQVVAYFNYANRTVLGLGINTDGDILGLSPNNNDEPDNWSHS